MLLGDNSPSGWRQSYGSHLTLKGTLMEGINIEGYYSKRLGTLNNTSKVSTEKMARCPFHDDKEPSLSINISTGLWFCHGTCRTGGNLLEFEAKLTNRTNKEAYASLCKEFNIENNASIPEETVVAYHENLKKNPEKVNWLQGVRGIGQETITRFKLGYDSTLDRYVIPIYRSGICINLRKYKPGSTNKVIGEAGHNSPAIFPYDNLRSQVIYIMEGETDCLLANQLGLPAITVTGGAGSWKEEWNKYFTCKDVVIVYDIDDAGRKGAVKLAETLLKTTNSLRVIDLPIQSPANGDFTDYIMTHGFDIEDFTELVGSTKDVSDKTTLEPQAMKITLPESSNSIYHGKYMEVPVMIAGKDTEPYNIPKVFKLSCRGGKKQCAYCTLNETKDMIFEVKPESEDTLSLININHFQLLGALKKIAGVNCEFCKVEVIEMQSIEEVIAIPELNYYSEQDQKVDLEYVTRRLYYSGHGLKSNKPYAIRGYNVTNPKDQHSTILITKAMATQGTLDPSRLTSEIKQRLKIFQVGSGTVKDKLAEIYKDFSDNVTHICNRQDVLLGIDLVYHSALSFYFCGIHVNKGWSDILILGDTRCGKSKTVEGLAKHYRAGEIVGGDKVTFAGLVGGAQQIGKGWVITWGKMVLNNGMMIAIDEMSSMDVDTIGLLSGIRTTGIAEVTAIRGGKTQARTRLLCLSNPRSGRKLSTYSKGVLAVRELIGRAEDIARFDCVVTAADTEIPETVINDSMTTGHVPHKYLSEDCRNLVLWAWTRSSDKIRFATGVEKMILDESLKLTEKYDSSIPIVTPAEQRIKVARMSVALAARLFSTDDSMEKVIVKEEHVRHVLDFLEQCFTKPSMGYDVYSEAVSRSRKHIESRRQSLKDDIKSMTNAPLLVKILLDYELIKKSDLEMLLEGWDASQVKLFLGWAGKNHLIHSTRHGYAKHSLFIQILKEVAHELDEIKDDKVVKSAIDIFGGKEVL